MATCEPSQACCRARAEPNGCSSIWQILVKQAEIQMTAWLRQLTMQTRNDLSQREALRQTTQVYVCADVCVFVCRNPDESSSSQRTRCVGCPVGIHNTSKTCAQDVQVRERDAEIESGRERERENKQRQ